MMCQIMGAAEGLGAPAMPRSIPHRERTMSDPNQKRLAILLAFVAGMMVLFTMMVFFLVFALGDPVEFKSAARHDDCCSVNAA